MGKRKKKHAAGVKLSWVNRSLIVFLNTLAKALHTAAEPAVYAAVKNLGVIPKRYENSLFLRR